MSIPEAPKARSEGDWGGVQFYSLNGDKIEKHSMSFGNRVFRYIASILTFGLVDSADKYCARKMDGVYNKFKVNIESDERIEYTVLGEYGNTLSCKIDNLDLQLLKKCHMVFEKSSKPDSICNTQYKEQEAGEMLCAAILEGNVKEAKRLVQAGADVNFKSILGETPLIASIISGNIELVKLLLKQTDIDIEGADSRGWTALIHAVDQCGCNPKQEDLCLPIIQLLLENGANVNAQDTTSGQTVLMFAFKGDHPEKTVALLLNTQSKINLELKDNSGNTALIHALPIEGSLGSIRHLNNRAQVIKLLLDRGAKADMTVTVNGEEKTLRDLALYGMTKYSAFTQEQVDKFFPEPAQTG